MVKIQVGGHKRGSIVRGYMIVDGIDGDLGMVKWGWHGGYAKRQVGPAGSVIRPLAHRVVLERKIGRALRRGEVTDHISGDRLDNRRSNLRAVTLRQNQQNRCGHDIRNKSGYRGVHWNKALNKWSANVRSSGLQHRCGFFTDVHEAGRAAAAKRKELGFLDGATP